MKAKTRISQRELFFAVLQSMVGVGILALPYHANKAAGSDGWITVLLLGVSLQVFILVLWLLLRRFPNETIFDLSVSLAGKPIGILLHIAYTFYFLNIVAYIFNITNDILIRWILPETPSLVLLILGTAFFVYACMGSLKNVIALFSFGFLFILILWLIPLLTLAEPVYDVRYILPIASAGWQEIVGGVYYILPAFIGFETMLVYFAFVEKPERFSSLKGAAFALLFVTVFYTLVVLISMIVFSESEMQLIPEPVLYKLRTITLTVFQRWDLVFLTLWTGIVASSAISFGFLGTMGIGKLFRLKRLPASIAAALIVFILASFMYLMIPLPDLGKSLRVISLVFGVILPVLLLAAAVIFKRGGISNAKEK